jgi:peptidoglycan/LPS O-acetylase OafA/YrhL
LLWGGVAVLACKQDRWRLGGDALLCLAIGGFAMTWATLLIAHGWLVDVLTASVPILAVLIVILVFTSQIGFIAKILEWKPLAHLGRISYGFYLYHNFLAFTILEDKDIYSRVARTLIGFLIVFIASELSWHLIERPLISFARARTDISSTEPYYNFLNPRRAFLEWWRSHTSRM